jgi:hypothetical protein
MRQHRVEKIKELNSLIRQERESIKDYRKRLKEVKTLNDQRRYMHAENVSINDLRISRRSWKALLLTCERSLASEKEMLALYKQPGNEDVAFEFWLRPSLGVEIRKLQTLNRELRDGYVVASQRKVAPDGSIRVIPQGFVLVGKPHGDCRGVATISERDAIKCTKCDARVRFWEWGARLHEPKELQEFKKHGRVKSRGRQSRRIYQLG